MEASLPQLILPIKLERSSERLTSLGGLVVLEELARAVGLWEEVDGRAGGSEVGARVCAARVCAGVGVDAACGGAAAGGLAGVAGRAGGAGGVGLGGGAGCGDGGGLAAAARGERGRKRCEQVSRKLVAPCFEQGRK